MKKKTNKEFRLHLLICAGTGCVANRSYEIKEELVKEITRRGLSTEVRVAITGCNGYCERGPILVVQPDGLFYQRVKKEDVRCIVEEHILKGKPVESLMYRPSPDAPPISKMMDIDFFKHQTSVVFRNRSRLDPEDIEDYLRFDGYKALKKALLEMNSEQIIAEIKLSGLRGRGGAGFPTGLKWELCRKSPGNIKYIVCNGDEGDPGAFMDRSVLEADPHAIIEGMIIGARAIGADKGIIYVRKEYPLAVKRVKIALAQAEGYGLLGENILGTGFDFSIDVVQGSGAFVCGEETALLASIEGRVGRPRPRPPYPVEKGLWGRPTNINNVETWANVPQIVINGANWFSAIGTKCSKGTKIFSLVGKISNTGLVEVPMGITLKEIINDIGGGIPNGKEFKAVQTGGPSGGCIPKSLLDLPIDYESLTKVGSMMGSGGMIVMDEDTCMVDIARYFLDFTLHESCGKCPSCRLGTKHMVRILNRITEGKGEEGDIEFLEDIGKNVKLVSLCGLGQTAANPVLTTIKYFRDEYLAHIKEKRCPALLCKSLISYVIDHELCSGCTVCAKKCPSDAITGEPKEIYTIDQKKCTKCGICLTVCPPKFKAVKKVSPPVK